MSLHVHERIDPRTIIEATRKRNGNGAPVQGSLFELPEENPPVRSAIEFYHHRPQLGQPPGGRETACW